MKKIQLFQGRATSRRNLRLLFLFALLLNSGVSFAQTLFQKSYSNLALDRASCVIRTSDGGYLAAGSAGTAGYLDKYYLVKTDHAGSVLWSKTYGGSISESISGAIQTADGGYMLVGTTFSFNTNPYGNIYLIKTDASGTITWQRHYGSTGYDFGYSILQTADGGYVVGGLTSSFGAGYYDFYIMKIDATGTPAWGTSIGGAANDQAYTIVQTADGGYVIAGQSNSYSVTTFNPYNIMLCKLNASGTLLWAKTYGGGQNAGNYICNMVRQTSDHGFILAGWTDGIGAGVQEIFVLKTDSAGTMQWSKGYGGANSDFGYDIRQTTDGGYAIAGYTKSFGAGNDDAYVITTDASGNMIWSVCYGDTAIDRAYSLDQTADGGYIIAGQTSATGSSNADFYLIKCDASGFTGCYENDVVTIVTTPVTVEETITPSTSSNFLWGFANASASSNTVETTLCTTVGISETNSGKNIISLYPNPVNDLLSFSQVLDGAEVFNVFGELIISRNGPVQYISVSNLADGIYFVRSGANVQRFVVQH